MLKILMVGLRKNFVVVIGQERDNIYYEIALHAAGLPPQIVQRDVRLTAAFEDVVNHMKSVDTDFSTNAGIDKLALPESSFYRSKDVVEFAGPHNARLRLISLRELDPSLGYLMQDFTNGCYNGGAYLRAGGHVWAELDASYRHYAPNDPELLRHMLP